MVGSLSGDTSSITLLAGIKLNSIRFTGIGDGAGASNIDLTWTGDRSPNTLVQFYFGATVPEALTLRPPEGSLAGVWIEDGSDGDEQIFVINLSGLTGCLLMDLHVTLVFNHDGSQAGIAYTVGSSTEGVVYPILPIGFSVFTPPGVVTS
jgi:hypothetical protein